MSDTLIRRMKRDDLEMVLRWRNDPEVRKYMYSTHVISLAEHANWFDRVADSPTMNALIFQLEGKPAGFVSISRLRGTPVADWGFYLAPDAQRGTGSLLGRAALSYGFEQLELHKICGQALFFNERSIRFHRKLGFFEEGTLREQHFDGTEYHSVVCFGMLRNEWIKIQQG